VTRQTMCTVRDKALVAKFDAARFPEELRGRRDPIERHIVVFEIFGSEFRVFGSDQITFPGGDGNNVKPVQYELVDEREVSVRVEASGPDGEPLRFATKDLAAIHAVESELGGVARPVKKGKAWGLSVERDSAVVVYERVNLDRIRTISQGIDVRR
jgi:hypothetical protein